jgi:transposase-like protein
MMTDTMSGVTDETSGTDVSDKPAAKRPSRLAERRAIRAGSPARAAVGELAESGALDGLFAKIEAGELDLTGDGGFVGELLKASLERGLHVELTDHLGYAKGDPDAADFPNSRNGTTPKTIATTAGDVDLAVPRDRDGTFTPRLVPKGTRRLGGLDDMIISLYAGGMTVRDIADHLQATLGTDLSHETVSNITDAVTEEILAWQARPLDALYPVIYLDAIVVKVRDGAHVRNKAAHIAVGVDMDGIKHVLGIWLQHAEGAKFWAGVCADLSNRGIRDVLIVCCDGLTGLPDAIEATWPQATVQTCVVHLIRASMRFVGYQDRKKVAAALKPVYTAVDERAAKDALDDFADGPWGQKYPHTYKTWFSAWDRFIPFLAFPPELRRVIYTTNSIESLNYQLRKVTKNRGHFPSDEAVIKLLWLAICNIEDKRARERAQEKGKPATQRKAPGRLVEGQVVTNWKQALAQLAIAYPDRINPHL